MKHVKRLAAFFLLGLFGLNGCVSEPDETTSGRTDDILSYYMPRTTEFKYLYQYSGFFSGKRDSLFNVDYLGRTAVQPGRSIDGHWPIEQYTVSSIDGLRSVVVDLYVSDSIVVDYGTDCSTNAERFLPLKGKLRVGNHWTAANNFKATDNYNISFLATVVAHYDKMTVPTKQTYNDVWQVNYEVTGTIPTGVNPPKEYLPKARRVIYFARGIGKVYEIAFSPLSEKQWENSLVSVDRR